MFNISFDIVHDLIEVRLEGMMTVQEVGEYINELEKQFIAHGLRAYAMVIDVTGCPIQSQDMINAMAQHMAAMPKARSLAVATGSSLAKMQIRRLFTQPYARIVATVNRHPALSKATLYNALKNMPMKGSRSALIGTPASVGIRGTINSLAKSYRAPALDADPRLRSRIDF